MLNPARFHLLARLAGLYNQTAEQLRADAIRAHQAGSISHDQLNQFLSAFGLPEYHPRLRVNFVIVGSFDIDDLDEEHVRQHEAHIGAALPNCPNISDESIRYEVVIDGVEYTDTPD